MKSTRKGLRLVGLIIILFETAVLLNRPSSSPAALIPVPASRELTVPFVRIKTADIPVEIARDSTAIQKGLSGRTSLPPHRGMLFIFSRPNFYHFWMPDMHFPIDIIWIAGGKVVGISENAQPETDLAHPRLYTPPQPAQYVVEVNAGFAARMKIGIGNPVSFNNIK